MNNSLRFACLLAVTTLFVGCNGGPDDPSYALTGTEEEALTVLMPDGGTALNCPSSKVLICHVPPGNPANAHTICVGKPAQKAHQANHGDLVGPCGPTGAGGGSSGAGGGISGAGGGIGGTGGGIGGTGGGISGAGGGSSGTGGGTAATDAGVIN